MPAPWKRSYDQPRQHIKKQRHSFANKGLSSRHGYLLEPNVCTKGSQASCGVWREDSGLDSRPCRKRRPSSRDDGGVSWVFSSCGARVGCLMKYHGDLREPLVEKAEEPEIKLPTSTGSSKKQESFRKTSTSTFDYVDQNKLWKILNHARGEGERVLALESREGPLQGALTTDRGGFGQRSR